MSSNQQQEGLVNKINLAAAIAGIGALIVTIFPEIAKIPAWVRATPFILLPILFFFAQYLRRNNINSWQKFVERLPNLPKASTITMILGAIAALLLVVFVILPFIENRRYSRILSEASTWQRVQLYDFDSRNDWPSNTFKGRDGFVIRQWEAGKFKLGVDPYDSAQASSWTGYTQDVLEDFYAEVEVHKQVGSTESNCGLMFRRSDAGSYVFRIQEDQKLFWVRLLKPDESFKTLIDKTHSNTVLRQGINRLTVVAKGAEFFFYINDKGVGSVTDATLTKGVVDLFVQALGSDEAVCEFDNLELRIP